MPASPRHIRTGRFETLCHDLGSEHRGTPLLMIHGSGPGVSAGANWRLALPELAKADRKSTRLNSSH